MWALGTAAARASEGHLQRFALCSFDLLEWPVDHDTVDGRLSPTPVGGAGPLDLPGRSDQQPIEVAAMARAVRRAFESTCDQRWVTVVNMCARWFEGDNDAGLMMWDPATGVGFDGLHAVV